MDELVASSSMNGVRRPPVVQPKPNVVRPSTSSILVNRCQEGNKVLEHLRNVAWQYSDIVPDYQVGLTTGVLYLSLKYHRLHPEYIHTRIEKLQSRYTLRILLIMCDVDGQHEDPIRELTKICLINNMTIIVSWTNEEAALYLMTYKSYEHKAPTSIKERIEKDYASVLRSSLTSVKGINKTDVTNMRMQFGSFTNISRATEEELLLCPGLGTVKVKRIKDAFEKPFRNTSSSSSAKKEKEKGQRSIPQMIAGEERPIASGSGATKAAASVPPPPRESSPPWDIELDLNDSD